MKKVREEIARVEKILDTDLPKIEQATDSHIVEVLLKTLDKVEAQLAKPGRYQNATDMQAVAVDALYRDAFLAYGAAFRRWLTQPEKEKGKLEIYLKQLKSAVETSAARLPFWQSRRER